MSAYSLPSQLHEGGATSPHFTQMKSPPRPRGGQGGARLRLGRLALRWALPCLLAPGRPPPRRADTQPGWGGAESPECSVHPSLPQLLEGPLGGDRVRQHCQGPRDRGSNWTLFVETDISSLMSVSPQDRVGVLCPYFCLRCVSTRYYSRVCTPQSAGPVHLPGFEVFTSVLKKCETLLRPH